MKERSDALPRQGPLERATNSKCAFVTKDGVIYGLLRDIYRLLRCFRGYFRDILGLLRDILGYLRVL